MNANLFTRAWFSIVLTALCGLAVLASAPSVTQAQGVKISQVYGAGGNSQSPLFNDYIELYNPGPAPQPLAGWSVQYAAATGVFSNANTTPLPNVVLQPGQYLLVQEGTGGTLPAGQTPALPTPDATGNIAMSATDSKIALVSSTTFLPTGTPTYLGNPTLVDFVGIGTLANWNDAAAAGGVFAAANNAPATATAYALHRLSCGAQDSNNSRNDWAVGWPAPRNMATTPLTGPLFQGITLIGTALPLTPKAGQGVRLTATPRRCATNDLTPTTNVQINTVAIGGGIMPMFDNGIAPDEVPNDGIYTAHVEVGPATLPGTYSLPIAVTDADGNLGGSYISIVVTPPSAPDNDNCSSAQAIPGPFPNTISGTVAGATVETNPIVTGATGGAFTSGMSSRKGVWYTVVGTGNTMTASLCSTLPVFDSVMMVMCGTCDGLTVIGLDDDSCTGAVGTLSTVSWCSRAGTTYFIWVANFVTTGLPTNNFQITISDNDTPCTTAFNCATCLGTPGPFTETEPGYGIHTNDGCDSTPNRFTDIPAPGPAPSIIRGTSRGVIGNRDTDWYRFQAPTNGTISITIDTLSTAAQAQLVSLGAGGTCPSTSVVNTPVFLSRCTTGTQSASANVTAGTWYAIRVVGGVGLQVTPAGTIFGGQMPGGMTYQYTMTVSIVPPLPPPPNNDCAGAEVVGPGTIIRTNAGATTDGAASCATSSGDVWFEYTPPCSYSATINTCGSNDTPGPDLGIDTVLSIHTACPGTAANELPGGCNDDFTGAPVTCDAGAVRDSSVTVALTGGVTYFIRVASFGANGTLGQFRLTISEPICGVTAPPGDDCFHTRCGETQYDFKNTPIPCGFFDPGSEPFDGTVLLGGGDPGNSDTRMRRLLPMTFAGVPSTAQVPIEIVSLNLVSCAPITVRYCNSPTIETWNVKVDLSPAPPPPPGLMTVTKTHANGGSFQSQFFVQPRFTFTRITGGPPVTRVLDTGNPPLPPMQLGSTDPAPWVHVATIDPPLTPSCALPGANFVPGVLDAGQSTPGSFCVPTVMCPKPVGHAGPGHLHVTGYTNDPCPCGPCCEPATGVCTEVSGANPEALCAALYGGTGIFKGRGKSCSSTADGDGIPDSYEDNSPCAGGTCATNSACVAHTNPSRTDSDGDGVPDNLDPAPWNRCIPVPTPICFQFDHVAPLGDGDCDGNGRCDLCEILLGAQYDCNRNGVPDNCEPDCNNNGVPDDYDLTCGTSVDANGNGILDDCERLCPIGDMNLDEKVDGQDIGPITVALLAGVSGPQFCAVDANANGVSDGGDIGIIVSALLTWPDPVIAGGTYWLVGDLSCNDGNRTVARPCIPGASFCTEWAIRNEGNALNCPVFAQLRNCNGVDQGAPQPIGPGATISIVRCVGNRELVVWCGMTGVECKISVKFLGFVACPLDQLPCP